MEQEAQARKDEKQDLTKVSGEYLLQHFVAILGCILPLQVSKMHVPAWLLEHHNKVKSELLRRLEQIPSA